MSYKRVIRYDYKPRLQWDQPAGPIYALQSLPKRSDVTQRLPGRKLQLPRWVSLTLFGLVIFLLGGMSTHELAQENSHTKSLQTMLSRTTDSRSAAATGSPAQPQENIEPIVIHSPNLVAYDHTAQNVADQPVSVWQYVNFRDGEDLAGLFTRLGLNPTEVQKIFALGETTKALKQPHFNQKIGIVWRGHDWHELKFEADYIRTLHVYKLGEKIAASMEVTEIEKRTSMAAVSINNTFTLAAQAAGIPDSVLKQLINIFKWDVDFALGVREGDSFAVLYEEFFRDGKSIKTGDILAAEFINQGKLYRAVRHQGQRYVDDKGQAKEGHSHYYSDLGQGLHKPFLRTPLVFTHISSYFNLARVHHILHTIRAHKGVDYAAPYGTPVKASGDGVVDFVGYQSGYGKTIILQHGDTYSTLYAHLSRISEGLKQGKSIRQGDLIGYVGATGLATGPHLHYEFRVNGIHQDPLTVALPENMPVHSESPVLDKTEIVKLQNTAKDLFAELESFARTHREAIADSGLAANTRVAAINSNPLYLGKRTH